MDAVAFLDWLCFEWGWELLCHIGSAFGVFKSIDFPAGARPFCSVGYPLETECSVKESCVHDFHQLFAGWRCMTHTNGMCSKHWAQRCRMLATVLLRKLPTCRSWAFLACGWQGGLVPLVQYQLKNFHSHATQATSHPLYTIVCRCFRLGAGGALFAVLCQSATAKPSTGRCPK